MLVPDIYGGSTELQYPPQQSKAVRVLNAMPPDLASEIGPDGPRYYWGGVGKFFAGPPYVGAIIVLLALMGFFILDGRHKWWILAVCALTIAMSWGAYFYGFNSFLLRWLPLYNKFRAPSMILVVPTFLLCMLATMTLDKILGGGRPGPPLAPVSAGGIGHGRDLPAPDRDVFPVPLFQRMGVGARQKSGRPRQFRYRDIWKTLSGPCALTANRFLAKA